MNHEKREAADGPAEGEQHAENPCAVNVVPAELVLRLAEECENHGGNGSHRCNDKCPRPPAVDERGCAQIGGKRFSV